MNLVDGRLVLSDAQQQALVGWSLFRDGARN